MKKLFFYIAVIGITVIWVLVTFSIAVVEGTLMDSIIDIVSVVGGVVLLVLIVAYWVRLVNCENYFTESFTLFNKKNITFTDTSHSGKKIYKVVDINPDTSKSTLTVIEKELTLTAIEKELEEKKEQLIWLHGANTERVTFGPEQVKFSQAHIDASYKTLPTMVLNVSPSPGNSFILQNVLIGKLKIGPASGDIRLSHCYIQQIEIEGSPLAAIFLPDCMIGELVLASGGGPKYDSLNIIGGTVGKITNKKNQEILYGRKVEFGHHTHLYSGAISPSEIQSYRDLLAAVEQKGDTVSSRFLKSEILRMERQHDSKANKIIGWLYDGLSDYGQSIVKPFVGLGVLTLFSFLLINTFDGAAFRYNVPLQEYCVQISKQLPKPAVMKVSKTNPHTSWEKILCSRHWRAWSLAIKPVVSPMGYFQRRDTVTASHWSINVWLFFQWLLTLTLITLFIFALRGRFKLH